MTLHLRKLCVGIESVEHLEQAQGRRLRQSGALRHDTRMMPKRRDEILAGGSLYWVIKGMMQVRQPILDITPEVDEAGRGFARLHLAPELVRLAPRAHRPFQGWRYLEGRHAPRDLPKGSANDDLPPKLMAALAEIGVR